MSAVLYVVENGVATLTLNRPDSRNALNLKMCNELIDAATSAAKDVSIKLFLIKASGPVFCAGADLKERQGMSEAQVRERRMKGFAAYAALEALPMPSIAVVQGPAVGSGCEIAGACDFIVATPAASFRTPEATRGTVGATQRLPRILGKRMAKDMMFTGRTLSAEEAREAGLVSRLVDDLDAELKKITKTILEAPPDALRLAKRVIDKGVELDPEGALETEIEAIEEQLAAGQWMGKKVNWVLGGLLERHASDQEALVTQTARVKYDGLLERARQAAGSLQALGIEKGDHVAILMPNGEDWLSIFYGAALIGAVTVPVNTRFKAAEIDFCLKQSGAKLLIYVSKFLNIDFSTMIEETGIDQAIEISSLKKGDYSPVKVQPSDLLLIQFTSGTTAYPKGVMLSHENMLRNAWAAGTRIGVRAEDRYFNCRPFFHVAGSTLSALMSLVFGCTLVTLPTFEAKAALAMLEEERCTLISGNDTIFQMLMGHEDFAGRKLSLRGGWAAAGPQTMRAIIDKLGMKSVCAAYGLSEASPNVVMSDWRDPEVLRVEGLAKPHDGMQLRIQEGEIQVKGWSVMRGYCNNPDATEKAFTPDGWLRTGDLGELTADGRLRMIGRLKDVFRVGGENVAPAEVEEVLLAHPAVETAQVIGVPDERLGEVPCAYVTLKSGFEVTEEELKNWTKEKSANFRVPRYLRIVADFESIGMTASGKVQKTKLREHALKEFNL